MTEHPDDHRPASPREASRGDPCESICEQFEAAWKVGKAPLAEEFARSVPASPSGDLLVDLLCIEIEMRRRAGEQFGHEELQSRFPGKDQEWFRSLFERLRTEDQILFVGERLGRYRVEAVEARGAFGNVYRARDEALGRLVAIKVARSACPDSRSYDQLGRESKILASLGHPGIVPVFDFGQLENGVPYIVLEYLSGKSLAGRIDDGLVSRRQAVEWIAAVADAVQYMHSRGVIHRDLKPANIVLDDRDIPRVADFGLAFRTRYTEPNSVEFAGTPCYMAPEQLAEQPTASPASDIWAIGAVLYELLTGRRPFSLSDLQEMARTGQTVEWPLPSQSDPAIPARLDRVCAKCLAVDPADRYPSAAHFMADLQLCLHPPRWSRRRALLAAGAGAAIIGTGAAWSMWHQHAAGSWQTSIRVLAWSPDRGLRWLDEAGALPLRSGEAVRLHIELGRPAFVFVAWIDAASDVLPLFPSTEGIWDWSRRQRRSASIALPSDSSRGWEMEVARPGLETVLVCAREQPASEAALARLRTALGDWEPQPATPSPVWLEFHHGRLVNASRRRFRKPQVASQTPIDHALFRNQHRLIAPLESDFDEVAAVTFSCQP